MKNDLISRKAAIDALNRLSLGETDAIKLTLRMNEYLKRLTSAEPEIVRCKDCRHGVDYYHEGDCYCSNPKWGLTYFGGSWEFYCADAERRTVERNENSN